MTAVFKILFAIILIEAITEILTKSEAARPFRALLFERGTNNKFFSWIHDLFDCGYCTSVWVGWFVAILLFRNTDIFSLWIDWFFIGLVLHRLSNILHNVIDFTKGKDDIGQGI